MLPFFLCPVAYSILHRLSSFIFISPILNNKFNRRLWDYQFRKLSLFLVFFCISFTFFFDFIYTFPPFLFHLSFIKSGLISHFNVHVASFLFLSCILCSLICFRIENIVLIFFSLLFTINLDGKKSDRKYMKHVCFGSNYQQ